MKTILTSLLLALFGEFVSLNAQVKILAFAGSTRKDSFNKKLINQAAEMARQQFGAQVTVIDLSDYALPIYNADFEKEQGMPESAKRLRALMIQSDAILIATPEYNASIPALLKNTLDWVSRSEQGASARGDVFKGKRIGIMSASPGRRGGARALAHLRAIIEDIGGAVITEEVSIPLAVDYFAEKKKGENVALKEELKQVLSK